MYLGVQQVWSDNSDVDFLPWGSGEPNDGGSGGEDCAVNSDTTFNDIDCTSHTRCFICQGKFSCCFGPALVFKLELTN